VDRHGRKDTGDRLVTDQQGNHGEDNCTRESGEVAELARAKRETGIVSVLAGVGVGQRRQQQRASMRAHMQAICNERNRPEQQAADNFRDHHGPTEPDHRPRLALAFFMPLAEKHMAVTERRRAAVRVVHGSPHFK
jgi:hypothetical protein